MSSFGFRRKADDSLTITALHRSLAIVEFDPSGRVTSANERFCAALGYVESEIKGKHHSIFVEPEYASSPEYRTFWDKLRKGEFDAQEYKRIGKGGRELWIQASYNPVLNRRGSVIRILKVATDVTAEKLKAAEAEAKGRAVSRVQAVIEFTPGGDVITANQNFLDALGYRIEEIKGKHHRMFVDPAYAGSEDYRQFWATLNKGEFIAAEFKRLGKSGKEVWIQASYNPVFDLNDKVMKVVKYATDVTSRVEAVNEIGRGLALLADRDVAQRIQKPFTPEFDKLRVDFNSSLERLQSALVQVAESADAIRTGTQEISGAADDLSRRTEHQAASLEETAAALEEVTTTVRKTAEGAAYARDVVAAAKLDTEMSWEVVSQAVASMGQIEGSARQISQIIGVIDEIAFQTNLLALNAGVEAARAGDAGRGFAVVASEVRALAQRSAEAAKEIKNLIMSSTAQVDTGVRLVGGAGDALKRISAQIAQINAVVGDIASSAHEQATGIQEINTAIGQMDQVTQQNAAMVEQATAATHSLVQEAGSLAELIGQFHVGSGTGNVARLAVASCDGRRAAAAPSKQGAPGRGSGAARPRLVHPSRGS